MAALLILAPLSGGCLEVPLNPCPDGDCFPLDQSALSELLSAPGAFDVLSYAEDFERLMVETDAPLLAPQGHRGRRNAPIHVGLLGACLAEVHGRPPEEVARITQRNTRALFRLPEAG